MQERRIRSWQRIHRLAPELVRSCRQLAFGDAEFQQQRRRQPAIARIRRGEHQAVARRQCNVLALAAGQMLRQRFCQPRCKGVHRQAHFLRPPQQQRALQQRIGLALTAIDLQQLPPVIGRQGQAQAARGEVIGVIGIAGHERAVAAGAAPPAEHAVAASHLHQPQTLRLQLRVQPGHARAALQRQPRQRQRNQPAGGLLDAAIGVIDQIVDHLHEAVRHIGGQRQAQVARIGGQFHRRAGRFQADALLPWRRPGHRARAQGHGQAVNDLLLALLHHRELQAECAAMVPFQLRREEVGAGLHQHRQHMRAAGEDRAEFGGDVLVAAIEADDVDDRFVIVAEFARADPFQVQRLVRLDIGLALAGAAVVGQRAGGDAPAGQRIRHLEADRGAPLGVAAQIGKPGGGIDIVAARPLQHLHPPFRQRRASAALAAVIARQVVADEGEAGTGAHVVATDVMQELFQVGRQFRLQHIDHFIDHADRQLRRHRLALQAGSEVQARRLAGLIDRLVGLDVDIDARMRHHQTGVLEHVFALAHHRSGEGHVGCHLLADAQAHPPLVVGHPPHRFQPTGRARQQRMMGDRVTFQRQQRVVGRSREGQQQFGHLAHRIARLVGDDLDAAGDDLDALAADPVRDRAEQVALGVAQVDGVGTGRGEIDVQRLGAVGQRALGAAAVFQADDFPARAAEPARAFQLERHLGARFAEAGRRGQTPRLLAALDQQFAGDLDAPGGAIAGEEVEDVAAGVLRRRQLETGNAVGVGSQFFLFQLDRKLSGVLQLAFHHRGLLRAHRQTDAAARHRLAAGIGQAHLAVDQVTAFRRRLVEGKMDVEMRFDVLGHPEGGAVQVVAQREAKFPAAGRRIGRQRETGIAAATGEQLDVLGQQLRPVRIAHFQLQRASRQGLGAARIEESTADELDLHAVARAVQRTVGYRVQLGVVDLAVVVEILRNEHAAGRILANDIALLRAVALHRKHPGGIADAGLQYTATVAPDDGHAGRRRAGLAVGGPHQHLLAGILGHRDGIGNEHQAVRAEIAHHRLDQIQTRFQPPQWQHDVARIGFDEVAAAAGQLEILGRRDRLGGAERIAETLDQIEARHAAELDVLAVLRGLQHGIAEGQPRRLPHRLLPRRRGDDALPGTARLLVPAVI